VKSEVELLSVGEQAKSISSFERNLFHAGEAALGFGL
jgi:hypothetical protein